MHIPFANRTVLDISQKSRGKPHVDRARSGSPKRRTFRNYDNNRRNEDRSHHNASDDRLPPIETCTDTESESSEINTTVTDIASNFVKAIGLSSLIHPTHDLRNSSEDRDQSTMPSSSYLLNLAGAQDLLMDACHVLEVTLPQFQLL